MCPESQVVRRAGNALAPASKGASVTVYSVFGQTSAPGEGAASPPGVQWGNSHCNFSSLQG